LDEQNNADNENRMGFGSALKQIAIALAGLGITQPNKESIKPMWPGLD